MGMFDHIRCEYPIDAPKGIQWQSKDTPAQHLDTYVITKDGRLLHEEYDLEDRSDPQAKGLMRLAGCATRVGERLVELPAYRGEIRFYGLGPADVWWEYSVLFKDGRVIDLKRKAPRP